MRSALGVDLSKKVFAAMLADALRVHYLTGPIGKYGNEMPIQTPHPAETHSANLSDMKSFNVGAFATCCIIPELFAQEECTGEALRWLPQLGGWPPPPVAWAGECRGCDDVGAMLCCGGGAAELAAAVRDGDKPCECAYAGQVEFQNEQRLAAPKCSVVCAPRGLRSVNLAVGPSIGRSALSWGKAGESQRTRVTQCVWVNNPEGSSRSAPPSRPRPLSTPAASLPTRHLNFDVRIPHATRSQ